MKVSHVHLLFTDLAAAIGWMRKSFIDRSTYQNEGMAVFAFENISYVFDKSDVNSEATVALASDDCAGDFALLSSRGGVVLENPTTQPWGVKTAYLQGLAKLFLKLKRRCRRCLKLIRASKNIKSPSARRSVVKEK